MEQDILRTLLEASPFLGSVAAIILLLRICVPPIIDAYTRMRLSISTETARVEKEHAQDRAALAAVGARWSESSERMLGTMSDMVQQLGTYTFSGAAMENDLKKALSNIEGLQRQLSEYARNDLQSKKIIKDLQESEAQSKQVIRDLQERITKLEKELELERSSKKSASGTDGNPPASG